MLPSWGWWTLAGSVLAALIIMLVAFLITKKKIRKIRDEYLLPENQDVKVSKALSRGEDSGQLLWDLKEKTENPLEDELLEYTINTVIRNDYKKVAIIGGSDYESQSLIKIASVKLSKKDLDFVLIMNQENLNDKFDEMFALLKEGGLISIVGVSKKDSQIKRLMSYLKTTRIRHDYLKVSKGIILVVK